ncbi:SurA N-terminal domain-containing protein [[Clostridium] colinum]|uniref:SurA N-terminal domain-containing protein n=1 Tax=[Clostridium] colinum TaxID=36835 RepID=UPI002025AE44|nr:SurA N-terminal domain-containing protein [[Clostridium] colinum]
MRKHKRGKKYYKYRNYIIIFILVVISFIGILYTFKYFNKSKDYVLKINREYISKEEFLLYLDEQEKIFEEIGGVDIWETDFDGIPAKEVAKNNTIDYIIFLKSVVYQANNLGIFLTEEEKQNCDKEAILVKKDIESRKPNVIIPLDICKKFKREMLIEQKVYEYITDSFVVDEKDFQKYFNNYMEKNINIINKINLDYIFIKNNDTFDAKKEAENIAKSINFNTNFKDIKEKPFIEVYQNITLERNMFNKNIEDKIYKLSEKSISSVIEDRDGFYIFKINKIIKPNVNEIEEIIREDYILDKKSEIYSLQTKNWVSNIKVQKNSEILSNI